MQENEASKQLREAQERSAEEIQKLREDLPADQGQPVETTLEQPGQGSLLNVRIGRKGERVLLLFNYAIPGLDMSLEQARALLNQLRDTINGIEPIRRHPKRK